MTSGQKIAFSLLGTMILFAGFFVCSQSGLFAQIETRYYSQAKIREKTDSLDKISEGFNEYIRNFLKFVEEGDDAYLKSPAISSFVDQNPSESDVAERRSLTEKLFQNFPALQGLRIIDKNGRNVHYSTYDSTDILRQNGSSKIYKNYPDILKSVDELDFDQISVSENNLQHKIFIDSQRKRIVLSFPLNWMSTFSASAVFYFDLALIQNDFANDEIITASQNFCAYSLENETGGVVVNIPVKYYEDFAAPVKENWAKFKSENQNSGKIAQNQPEKILEIDDGRFWTLINSGKCDYFIVGGVYTSDIFELSQTLKYLIYGTVGLTIFLILFLIFSLKTDKKLVIKKRIKKIQYSIISEYLENKEKIEWDRVVNQLKSRKNDLSQEILRAAGVKSKKKAEKLNLDDFLEQNWQQIFSVIAPQSPEKTETALSAVTLDQIRNVIEQVLKETTVKTSVTAQNPSADAVDDLEEVEDLPSADAVADLEEVEDLPPADAVDELEEIEDLPPADAIDELEEVEDLPSADAIDDLEEVEGLPSADAIDDLEEVEDLPSADVVDDLEEVEDLPSADAVEDLEEVEDLPSADVIDDLEEVEDLPTADAVAELEEVEDLPPADAVADLEEVEDLPTADAVDDLEEVEDLPSADAIADLEEVEDLPSADAVDDLEEVEDLPSADAVADLEEVEDLPSADAIDDLEEVEDLPSAKAVDPMKIAKLLNSGIQYKYEEANDSFVRTEKFATVENLFGEELAIGTEYLVKKEKKCAVLNFKIEKYIPVLEIKDVGVVIKDNFSEVEDNSALVADELEELNDTEMYHFSMTQFGANPVEVQDLEDASDAIVENEGIYSISENLEYSSVALNAEFKKLVDSVLK